MQAEQHDEQQTKGDYGVVGGIHGKSSAENPWAGMKESALHPIM
jgi:hypothetical protein